MFLPIGIYSWRLVVDLARKRRQSRLLTGVAAPGVAERSIDGDPGGSRDRSQTDTKAAHTPALGADGLRDG